MQRRSLHAQRPPSTFMLLCTTEYMKIIAVSGGAETPMDDRALFRKETFDLCFDRIKISCFVAIPVFSLFSIIDFIQEPTNFRFFLLLRMCESLFLLSILRYVYKSQRPIHPFIIGALIFSSLGFFLSLMIRYALSYPQLYTQALSLILIGMGLGMPWRVKEAFYTASSILLFYILFNFSKGGSGQVVFVNNLFFLATVIAITLATTYVNHRLRFKESRSRYNLNRVNNDLNHAKDKLESSNMQLEKALRELKETEVQLVQSSKMAALGLLVAGMAHEINNPVSCAKANTSLIRKFLNEVQKRLEVRERDPKEAEMKHSIEEVNTATEIVRTMLERIEGIVTDLKTFARKDEAHFKPADPHGGLDSTIMLLNYELGSRIRVVKEYGKIGLTEMIPGQINQVFMNVLQNAIDAIPQDKTGEIRIKTWKEGERVHISIQDGGEGIPPENLSRIFEPFFTTK